MLPVPPKKGESKRTVQFVGICADARKLGVCREHLYRVLTGQRVSQSLLKRYRELKEKGYVSGGPQPEGKMAQPVSEGDQGARAKPRTGGSSTGPGSEGHHQQKGKS
jgi:hypothetical protein